MNPVWEYSLVGIDDPNRKPYRGLAMGKAYLALEDIAEIERPLGVDGDLVEAIVWLWKNGDYVGKFRVVPEICVEWTAHRINEGDFSQ